MEQLEKWLPESLRWETWYEAYTIKERTQRRDIVIIKSDEKNRGKWKIEIVHQLFIGQDGVIRGVRLREGKSYLEQPIQCLYQLEWNCEVNPVQSNLNIDDTKLNIKAKELRPKRNAAAIAKLKI